METRIAAPVPRDALPCAIEGSLAMGWIPLGRALDRVEWTNGFDAIAPICSFLLAAALSTLLLSSIAGGISLSSRAKAFLRAGIALFACILGVLFEGSSATASCLYLFAFGVLFSLELSLWFQRFSRIPSPSYAIATLTGLLASTGIFLATLNLPATFAYLIILTGSIAGAVIGTRRLPPPDASPDDVSRSKLLDVSAAQLALRYIVSFSILGLLTGAMLVLFAAGPGRNADIVALYWLPAGTVALSLILILGWVRNREPDFMLTLELSLVIALVAFFPIYPGTDFNQRLALAMSAIWAITLAGTFLLVSKEIDLACALADKKAFASGFSSLLLGLLSGCAAMMTIIDSDWYAQLAQGPYGRTTFVSTLGGSSIALTYISTNILLNRDRLRCTRLLARGSFATLVPAMEPNGQTSDAEAEKKPTIEQTCRSIALEYGLTPREHDVLVILAHGNSMARVQEDLVISEGTAITHRRNLYRKLSVTNKQELIDFVLGR